MNKSVDELRLNGRSKRTKSNFGNKDPGISYLLIFNAMCACSIADRKKGNRYRKRSTFEIFRKDCKTGRLLGNISIDHIQELH